MKEIVLIRNSKTIRSKCSARGKVNNNKLILLQVRAKLKTFSQAYGKKKQVLIKKPRGLTLEKGYCKNTRSKNYCITQQMFDSVLKGMKKNGDPEMTILGTTELKS